MPDARGNPTLEDLIARSAGAFQPGLAGQTQQALQPFTQGPLGQSPATQAGLAAFQQNTLPILQNQAGLAGLGRSPALLDAVGQSLVSAQVPFIQQDLQNRLQAAGMLQNQQQIGLGGLGQAGGLLGQEAGLTGQLRQFGGVTPTLGGRAQGLQEFAVPEQLFQAGTGLAANIANQEAQRQLQASQVAGNQFLGLGANVFAPAAQLQQQQAQFGLEALGQGGGLQQQTTQNFFNTLEQERLRRQALAEQGSFGTFGGNPSNLASAGGQTIREVSESSGK